MTVEELLLKIKSFAGAISGASPGDDDFINDIKKDADQALAQPRETCEWEWDEGYGLYSTSCGKRCELRADMETCPFKGCGKPIKEIKE